MGSGLGSSNKYPAYFDDPREHRASVSGPELQKYMVSLLEISKASDYLSCERAWADQRLSCCASA
jgi:hypothetical protein